MDILNKMFALFGTSRPEFPKVVFQFRPTEVECSVDWPVFKGEAHRQECLEILYEVACDDPWEIVLDAIRERAIQLGDEDFYHDLLEYGVIIDERDEQDEINPTDVFRSKDGRNEADF